ncbi:ATP synthase subunit I [Holophaga foetida]|uniref:ATP synthase subunit I n=1 Tax=Holophaga foetida TaxID=35839 RepID=UPI000247262E|nr:ATP synthase subunit I [Holophaga foetida]
MTTSLAIPMSPDPGSIHMVWIGRFQLALLPLGGLLWLLKSWRASLVFLVGGLASIGFWYTHRWVVARMLTPSLRLRWFYAVLSLLKLALIALVLYGMIEHFPGETLPLVTGVLLFVLGILLEAVRLVFNPTSGVNG